MSRISVSGLAATRGEIVAFTDDDCRPHEGWVAALASGVSSSPPCAGGGTSLAGVLAALPRVDRQLSQTVATLETR